MRPKAQVRFGGGRLEKCLYQVTRWPPTLQLCAEDKAANDQAVLEGSRIFSAYLLPDEQTKFWLITEADRSVTTFLLPAEY
jgi:hypothetical protein